MRIFKLLIFALFSSQAHSAICLLDINYACPDMGYASGTAGYYLVRQHRNCSDWNVVSTEVINSCGSNSERISKFVILPTYASHIDAYIAYSCQEIGYPQGTSGYYVYGVAYSMNFAQQGQQTVNSCGGAIENPLGI